MLLFAFMLLSRLPVLALANPSAAAAADPASAVAAHYPGDLAAELTKDGEDSPENREQSYSVITTPSGDYIVAAYSNKARGTVVLLQKQNGVYSAVQEISKRIGERNPEVRAVDLDADGVPEAVVTFEYGMNATTEAHLYRVANGQLQLISPTEKHGNSVIGYPHLLDVNGNGVLDLENDRVEGTSAKPVVVREHYVLRNGQYVAAPPFDYYHLFYREEGDPITTNGKITVPAAMVGKSFRMVIVNGATSDPDYRVSAGTVTLNGVVVAAPSDFSPQRSSWTIPVSLQQSNTITVRLEGKPRSRVAIVICHD